MKRNTCLFLLFTLLLIATAACQRQDQTPAESSQPEQTVEQEADSSTETDAEIADETESINEEETAVSPSTSPDPTPEPQIIETLSASIGAEGGTLASADGTMELSFPPDALAEMTAVTIVLREAVPADGAVLSPVIDITLEPELSEPLTIPATLIFHDRGEEGVRYGRFNTLPGHVEAAEGDTLDEISYWQPLEYTRINEDGDLQLWMAHFSTYAILDSLPENCDAPSLMPPAEAPDAFAYVGRKLLVNQMSVTAWQDLTTTVPPFHPSSADDQLMVQQQNIDGCGQVTAVDIFTPVIPIDTPVPQAVCNPNFSPWQTPDAPPAHQYYSTEIFVNGTLTDTVMADNPPPYFEEGVQTITQLNNGQRGGEQACSSAIIHTYVAPPPVQSDTLNPTCIPNSDFLNPSYMQPGYDYIGHDVFVNGNYIADLSTIPMDRTSLATDMLNPTTGTTTSNGTLVCETYVGHLFALQGAGEPNPVFVTDAQTMPPDAIEGYSYQGYETMVNDEPYPEMSTLPPMPSGADDIHLYRSSSSTIQGSEPITATVNHWFKPQNQGSCGVMFEWFSPPEMPACFRYVGADVVINNVYDEFRSSRLLERVPQPTDLVRVYSETTMVGHAAQCAVNVAHVFEPIECAPPTIIISMDEMPFFNENGSGAGAFTNIYFPSGANLSEEDWAFLASISIRTPWINEDGSRSIALPPGSQVEYSDGQATITVPQTE